MFLLFSASSLEKGDEEVLFYTQSSYFQLHDIRRK